MQNTLLIISNFIFCCLWIRATWKLETAESKARIAKFNLDCKNANLAYAKTVLEKVVGKPVMTRNDINQKSNSYLN